MTVYIAAPYPAKLYAMAVALRLADAGIVVTSRWLHGRVDDSDAAAREDLHDIDQADVFVALNPEGWANAGTGGRHFEMGHANKAGKPIVLVGARTNVFHRLSHLVVIPHVEGLVAALRTLNASPVRL